MDFARVSFVRHIAPDFVRTPLAAVLERLCLWDARFRERRALADLDTRRRADLGLTAHDISLEIAKPFWRA